MEKQFTVGNIFSRSFDIFGGNFPFMTTIAVLATVPAFLMEMQPEGSAAGALIQLLQFLLSFMLEGAVVYGVFQHLTGQRMGIGPSFTVALRRLGYLALVSIVTMLAIGLGTILLVVPGIIVALIVWVAVPVTVVEKGGVGFALRRSAELTSGNRGTIFLISFLMGLMTMVAAGVQLLTIRIIASMGMVPGTPGAALGHWPFLILTTGMVTALSSVVVTVGYYALRNEVDGVATEDLASVFE